MVIHSGPCAAVRYVDPVVAEGARHGVRHHRLPLQRRVEEGDLAPGVAQQQGGH